VQVGPGAFQLNVAPEGVDVRLIFSATPEHISYEEGGFMTGTGFMVIARLEVEPDATQLAFVPYTCKLPEVAVGLKLTVQNASPGFIWLMVAPVPV
jgi:hypothetical protein